MCVIVLAMPQITEVALKAPLHVPALANVTFAIRGTEDAIDA